MRGCVILPTPCCCCCRPLGCCWLQLISGSADCVILSPSLEISWSWLFVSRFSQVFTEPSASRRHGNYSLHHWADLYQLPPPPLMGSYFMWAPWTFHNKWEVLSKRNVLNFVCFTSPVMLWLLEAHAKESITVIKWIPMQHASTLNGATSASGFSWNVENPLVPPNVLTPSPGIWQCEC